MLHEFKVKNYLSFKEEQTLSMEATADKTYEDFFCIEMTPKIKLLKLGLIYGANASGKSNLLKGLNALNELVLEAKNNKSEKIERTPFLLDGVSRKENTAFSISFFIDKVRYIYEISFNDTHIDKEKLQFYPKSRAALLFERTFNAEKEVSEIKFGNKLHLSEKDKNVLESNTIKNSTLFSVYNKLNVQNEGLEKALDWFSMALVNTLKPKDNLTKIANEEVEKSEKNKNFILEIIKKADFNILDAFFEEKVEEISDELLDLIQESETLTINEKEKLLIDSKLKRKALFFLHHTSSAKYSLPYEAQSDGTKRYYGFAAILTFLIEEKTILPIDEIESSLHFELINHFLKTFLANASSSQILCTTHNIHLLDQDYLRKDAVWFCEKNENGATELFSAADFDLKENDSLFKFYKIGKLGAVPNLGSILLNQYQIEAESK